MAVHLEFSEEWLRDYEKRTGKKAKEYGAAVLQQADTHTAKKRSKYGNCIARYAGRVFDSRHEAEVFKQMELRVRAGEIAGVVCQQPFLLPGGVKYIADFVVLRNDGTYEVVDAKSEATAKDKVYRIKKRQMKEIYGIEILEV